mgnify:CR=1 FL=1
MIENAYYAIVFSLIVKLKDTCFLNKYQRIRFIYILLKFKLHTNIMKLWHVFQHNPILLFKVIFSNFLKNKKLVLFLFTFDQVLAGDDCDPFIVFGGTVADDFIWFSFLTYEELYWNFTNSLVSYAIVY